MKATEPIPQAVDAAAFKRQTHILDGEDDANITALLIAAQSVVETATGRPMVPRAIELQARAGCGLRWFLPVCPVSAPTALHWQDADGVWQVLDHTALRLEMPDDEPQVVFPSGFLDAVDDGAPLRLALSAGHAADAMPPQLEQAVVLLAKDWFEAGIAVEKKEFLDVSFGCKALMRQIRYRRPCEWASA